MGSEVKFMNAGIKFCGGCNPHYDRKAYAAGLGQRLGGALEIARPEKHYEVIYVVCGCTACCADISALKAERFVFVAEEGRYQRTVETR